MSTFGLAQRQEALVLLGSERRGSCVTERYRGGRRVWKTDNLVLRSG